MNDPARVIFCLNVTQALNMALLGILGNKDRVVTTSMEHNSVMRPLRYLEGARGVRVSVSPCSPEGFLDPSDLLKLVTARTRLIVMTHASNVSGGLMSLKEVAKGNGDALLLVDADQTSRSLPRGHGVNGDRYSGFHGTQSASRPAGHWRAVPRT